MPLGNLAQRSITGVLFATVVIGSIWWNPLAQTLVFSIFMALGLWEFLRLFQKDERIQLAVIPSFILGIGLFGLLIANLFLHPRVNSLLFAFPLFFLFSAIELWRKKSDPILNIAVSVFGVFYLVIPFYLSIELNVHDDSKLPLVAGMFFLIWANDTFAYFTGRAFGKTKLFERISPKKTWEGTFGGIVFTLLAGFLIGTYINQGETLFWMVSAVIIAPCSIYGDLLESLFKRSLNIKDSGNILPGHGGILDRFDAVLFAVPFFYCWTHIYSVLA